MKKIIFILAIFATSATWSFADNEVHGSGTMPTTPVQIWTEKKAICPMFVNPKGFTMGTDFQGLSVQAAYFVVTDFNTATRPSYITYKVSVYASKAVYEADKMKDLEVRTFTKELNPREPGNVYQQFYRWIVKQKGYETAVIDQ